MSTTTITVHYPFNQRSILDRKEDRKKKKERLFVASPTELGSRKIMVLYRQIPMGES